MNGLYSFTENTINDVFFVIVLFIIVSFIIRLTRNEHNK